MLIKVIALLFVVAVIFAECLIALTFLGSGGPGQDTATAAEQSDSEGTNPQASPAAGHPKPDGSHGDSSHGAKPESSPSSHSKEGATKAASGKHGQGGTKTGHGGKAGESHAGTHDLAPTDMVELDLERFVVTMYQPNSSTVVRVDFHLFGMVAAKDREEFERLMEVHQHRFREQVLVIVRRAEPADLADPGLGLIKRQILEKTNALLGKPLLQAVVVSDFSYLEQ